MLDLRRSAIVIPVHLREVRYNADHFPGAPGVLEVEGGANCQQYAYSVLRHHGFVLPDLRSDELWQDRDYTAEAERMEPLDLVLVHDNPDTWGAHVGLCVGADLTWSCTSPGRSASPPSRRSRSCSNGTRTGT